MKTDKMQQATEAYQQARKEQILKCGNIIDAALKEFDCVLEPEFIFRGPRTLRRVLVLPREEGSEFGRINNDNNIAESK